MCDARRDVRSPFLPLVFFARFAANGNNRGGPEDALTAGKEATLDGKGIADEQEIRS